MDKKIFTIEEQCNNQKNKIYAHSSHQVCSEGVGRLSHFLPHGMVGGVPSGSDTSLFLRENGETGAWVYKEDMLQGVVNPLNTTLFNGQEWVFQQDSAPAHKAKMTQEWLQRNLLNLIIAKNWSSGNPDLNPLDCKLWAVLMDRACQKHHNNLESLKKSHVKAAAEILLETVHVVAAEWLECLKACIEAGGGHFE